MTQRIKVTPEQLRQGAQQLRQASSQLEEIGSRVGNAYNRMDAEARSAAGLGGRVREAQSRAAALAQEVTGLAIYLAAKANALEQADRAGFDGMRGVMPTISALQNSSRQFPQSSPDSVQSQLLLGSLFATGSTVTGGFTTVMQWMVDHPERGISSQGEANNSWLNQAKRDPYAVIRAAETNMGGVFDLMQGRENKKSPDLQIYQIGENEFVVLVQGSDMNQVGGMNPLFPNAFISGLGFSTAFTKTIRAKLLDLAKRHPNANINFVGYSQGGIEIQNLAKDQAFWKNSSLNIASISTYGTPNTFDNSNVAHNYDAPEDIVSNYGTPLGIMTILIGIGMVGPNSHIARTMYKGVEVHTSDYFNESSSKTRQEMAHTPVPWSNASREWVLRDSADDGDHSYQEVATVFLVNSAVQLGGTVGFIVQGAYNNATGSNWQISARDGDTTRDALERADPDKVTKAAAEIVYTEAVTARLDTMRNSWDMVTRIAREPTTATFGAAIVEYQQKQAASSASRFASNTESLMAVPRFVDGVIDLKISTENAVLNTGIATANRFLQQLPYDQTTKARLDNEFTQTIAANERQTQAQVQRVNFASSDWTTWFH